MALQSMTGFARHEASYDNAFWVWEMRSVNGKGLDLRIRIPPGFEALEIAAKKLLSSKFSRGNMQISLTLDNSKSQITPTLNEDMADALLEVAKRVQAKTGGEMPSVADLMSMRGVVELGEDDLDEAGREVRQTAVLDSLAEAAKSLIMMREAEGKAVAIVLQTQLATIGKLREQIDQDPSRTPEAILAHMNEQVATFLQGEEKLDPQRLHQEAVVLATKADLQEELDRLTVHLKSAGELLSGVGPIGRKLDFLAQELHRECNTICSKSNSASVTALGLDMKLVIDQFREQIQNME